MRDLDARELWRPHCLGSKFGACYSRTPLMILQFPAWPAAAHPSEEDCAAHARQHCEGRSGSLPGENSLFLTLNPKTCIVKPCGVSSRNCGLLGAVFGLSLLSYSILLYRILAIESLSRKGATIQAIRDSKSTFRYHDHNLCFCKFLGQAWVQSL